ncbi:unnamed protein product [Adineta steineri]|uniref:Peptidase M14 domain-containing protein n=1 Tax=Adineta steineri TaxID=433720 RepID=A0A814WCL8_9BILA|nr:unnamed protein product [Adineta steineri]CAF1203421.1 unnamed protein product [Adineta steineri]
MYIRCLILCIAFVLATASKKRYDGNILVSVTPYEEKHFKVLSLLEDTDEINIWNDIRRNSSVHVMFNNATAPWLMGLFSSLSMKPSIMHNDVQALVDQEENEIQLRARSGAPRGIHDAFLNYDEVTAWLKELVGLYPQLCTLISIGKTYENRDIWLIKCTGNNGATNKKKACLDFGIHAREWISPATGVYIINELVSKYAAGGLSKELLDTWEFHIIPILNPDGYAHSHARERMWRKNRKLVSGTCYGVDLNRNFGYQWNTGGSSASACSDTFHGGSPMSENEAKALQNYMTGKSWNTYLTFHSYGQWWFTNWGYTTANPPQYDELKQKANIGANAIKAVHGRAYTVGSSAQILYVASGGSEDWTRGALNILYSYCIELPPTGGTGFIAPVSEILKTGLETFAGVAAYLKALP